MLKSSVDISSKEVPFGEHPLETLAKPVREQADIFAKLKPNEVIFTNLPGKDVPELESALSIQSFLHKEVGKKIELLNVRYHNSLATDQLPSKTSAITLTLGSKKDVYLVKSTLRKHWFLDTLLKVKTSADTKREDFSNRTVIIQNIPKYLNSDQILNYFGKNGAVVGMELPMVNSRLKKIREELEQDKTSQSEIEKKADLKRAAITIEESLKLDPEYQNTVKLAIGEDKFRQLKLHQTQT